MRSFFISIFCSLLCKVTSQFLDKHPIIVSPSLLEIASWSDKRGMLGGVFQMKMMWNNTHWAKQVGAVSNPSDSLKERNFYSGKSAISTSPTTCNWGGPDSPWCMSSKLYVGEWKQAVNGAQYPFDEQTAVIKIELPVPLDVMFFLDLQCSVHSKTWPQKGCRAYDAEGREIATEDQAPHHGASKIVLDGAPLGSGLFPLSKCGFTWTKLTCEPYNSGDAERFKHVGMECKLTGEREPRTALLQQVVPGMIMLLIGFGSFCIPVNMAMPRVAVTMIALLTFMNKGSSVVSTLPTSGISIVEIIYVAGGGLMLFNMVGHILSFNFHELSDEIAHLSMYWMLSLFMLLLSIVLHVRECPLLSPALTISIILISTLACVASWSYVLWARWGQIKEAIAQIRERKSAGQLSSIEGSAELDLVHADIKELRKQVSRMELSVASASERSACLPAASERSTATAV